MRSKERELIEELEEALRKAKELERGKVSTCCMSSQCCCCSNWCCPNNPCYFRTYPYYPTYPTYPSYPIITCWDGTTASITSNNFEKTTRTDRF